jgi:cell division protein ZapA (FtsZ GTPase activity inhibitor)
MAARETVEVRVSGYTFRLAADPEERQHIERAARKVTDMIEKLSTQHASAATPARIATMAAFQLAYDLSVADEMLSEAERLHVDRSNEKAAVQRLEDLLARVDSALAY